MKTSPTFAVLVEKFFIERLMKQRQASPHTIKSYRDTFRLLLAFTQKRLNKSPSRLELSEIDAPLIAEFLESLEKERGTSARSRNLRLTALRSFFRYVAMESPANSGQIQRILAIPSKRHEKALISYLTQSEVAALLASPQQETWLGRRDYALLLVAVHTGLRLSELRGLQHKDIVFGSGAHIRVTGKGRKERCTPLTKQTALVLKAWLQELLYKGTDFVFPNARGGQLSADGIQYILGKHSVAASEHCPSLSEKRVTAHVLRHTTAMELLQSGVDRALIALWLGHESVETTQIYLHANLALKEKLLLQMAPPEGQVGRYQPDDELLKFLTTL
ncbi:MAG: integrase [Candidatus Melainabacteria bacterium]|nr:MAG: integrase [Candidatus Melainabacteria bacterium]